MRQEVAESTSGAGAAPIIRNVQEYLKAAAAEFGTTVPRLLAKKDSQPIRKLSLVAYLLAKDLRMSDGAIAHVLAMKHTEIPGLRAYMELECKFDLSMAESGFSIRDRFSAAIEGAGPQAVVVPTTIPEAAQRCIAAVCAERNLAYSDLAEKTKIRTITVPRSVAILLMAEHGGMRPVEISRLFAHSQNSTLTVLKLARVRVMRTGEVQTLFLGACKRLGIDSQSILTAIATRAEN